jgi:hypothetical protein
MARKIKIRRLTDLGYKRLIEVCTNEDIGIKYNPDEDFSLLTDDQFSAPLDGNDSQITVKKYDSAKQMAENICNALRIKDFYDIQSDYRLWGWLTFALWDNFQTLDKEDHPLAYTYKPYKFIKGEYKLREKWVFIPAEPKDWHKYQRHIVRNPCELYHRFGSDADHLIERPTNSRGEAIEQLTSRHPFWDSLFIKVGKKLYWDDKNMRMKPGTGGKDKGAPRRLARIFRQFDVTWQIDKTDASSFVKRLPKEFDRFR